MDDSSKSANSAILSPLGRSRYGRNRKPKISDDFCNIDDIFKDAPARLASPKPKALEIDSLFMPKQIQPLPKSAPVQSPASEPKASPEAKVIKLPLKERKFFKKNDEEQEQIDLSQVMKIVNSGSSESPKPSFKPVLRTYGNKRKLPSKSDVVESFGLPDNPIVPVEGEVLGEKLVGNVKENGNSIDLQENNVNNCTLNIKSYVVFDEIQMKAEECMVKNMSIRKVASVDCLNLDDELLTNNNVEEKINGNLNCDEFSPERKSKNARKKDPFIENTPTGEKRSRKTKDDGRPRYHHRKLELAKSTTEKTKLSTVSNKDERAQKRGEGFARRQLRSSLNFESIPMKTVELITKQDVIEKMQADPTDIKERTRKRNEDVTLRQLRSSLSHVQSTPSKLITKDDKIENQEFKTVTKVGKARKTKDVTPRPLRSSLSNIALNRPENVEVATRETKIENLLERAGRRTENSTRQLRSSGDIEIIPPETVDLTTKSNTVEMLPEFPVVIKEEPIEVDSEALEMEVKGEPDFEVGDLMWAKIGNHPYWPCLLCLEPDQDVFVKVSNTSHGSRRVRYHVRFFGDKGRRSWVSSKSIFPFCGPDDLERLYEISKKRSGYFVPERKKPKWTVAVDEAVSLQNKTVEERLDFFSNMFATKTEKKGRILGISERAKLKTIKQEVTEEEPAKPIPTKKRRRSTTEEPPPKKKRERSPKETLDHPKRPKLSPKPPKTIEEPKSKSDMSEASLSDTDSSSKLSTNSLEAQVALHKRNNIFKGAYKGWVCQVCEKQDDVSKCRGCYGHFHASCVSRVVSEKLEDTEVTLTNEMAEDNGNDDGSDKESVKSLMSSPEFKKLSLAEQIDLKMMEVMKKFDYTTIYAEPTSDYTSSEESIPEKPKEPSKKIQHVTAEGITFSTVEPDPLHNEDYLGKKEFKCNRCLSGLKPPCLVCGIDSEPRQKCSMNHCGRMYHLNCLHAWPQTKAAMDDSFVCPTHVCHTCVSDNPKGTCSRYPTDNLVKCVKCPSTYHSSNHCIPAGTVILSTKQVVCNRHISTMRTFNTTWCFICASGGDLICCETCPTSVHLKCLKIELGEDDTYICDDCESGRCPLYDEIVWVKLGNYRWWPALILFPNEIPEVVAETPHIRGEFVVKFFGTNDHYWVSRGRVFLFQEGDEEHLGKARSRMDVIFRKAVEEAITAFQLKKSFKTVKEAEMKANLKPPPYVKIKYNKPVGNVKQFDGNTSNTTACGCNPDGPFPCGPDSDCLNRLLLTECDPSVCPAGNRCNNQRFEKREYPPLEPFKTQGKGWGLRTLAPIKQGQFVIEYVGELIDEAEYKRRVRKMHERKEDNYYFLTIDTNRMIDAGPKGNLARFMNHSCQPNCQTQKWTVKGDTRVGLFTTEDVPAGAELTFNYNLECIGKEKKICRCGAANCSGFIGVKTKSVGQEELQKKPKKLVKKKNSPAPTESVTEKICFVCNESGDVMGCHNKVCNKFYHLKCVDLDVWPEGKWICPWHSCSFCSKRTIRCCVKCLNSYCPRHSEGNVRHDKLLGFVCSKHDPQTKEPPEMPTDMVEDNLNLTETTDVTSATSDDRNIEANSIKTVDRKKKGRPKRKTRNTKRSSVERKSKSSVENTATVQKEVKLALSVPTRHLRTTKRISDPSDLEKFLKKHLELENNLPIRKRTRARCETTL